MPLHPDILPGQSRRNPVANHAQVRPERIAALTLADQALVRPRAEVGRTLRSTNGIVSCKGPAEFQQPCRAIGSFSTRQPHRRLTTHGIRKEIGRIASGESDCIASPW